jgi:hypothetical protein
MTTAFAVLGRQLREVHAVIQAHSRDGGLEEGAALVCLDDTTTVCASSRPPSAILPGEKRPTRCFTRGFPHQRLPEEGSGTRGLISMSDLAGGVSGGAEGLEPRTPGSQIGPGCVRRT